MSSITSFEVLTIKQHDVQVCIILISKLPPDFFDTSYLNIARIVLQVSVNLKCNLYLQKNNNSSRTAALTCKYFTITMGFVNLSKFHSMTQSFQNFNRLTCVSTLFPMSFILICPDSKKHYL